MEQAEEVAERLQAERPASDATLSDLDGGDGDDGGAEAGE